MEGNNKGDMMDIKLKRLMSRKKGAKRVCSGNGNKRVPWNNCASWKRGKRMEKGSLFHQQIPQAWPSQLSTILPVSENVNRGDDTTATPVP